MADVRFIKNNYGTQDSIVAFPEHLISVGHTFDPTDAKAVTLDDGRKVIQAGTIYDYTDDNGDTKTGVVLYEVDVTYGSMKGAIVRHGWIRTDKLPAAPTANQKSAMPLIEFV